MAGWPALMRWAEAGGDVRVGVAGAGFIARGVVHRLRATPGVTPALVVNRRMERAREALAWAGVQDDEVVVTDDGAAIEEAAASGRIAVSSSAAALVESESISIVIEATGALDYGASLTLDALAAGKHVVSYNAELDATLGWLLHREAAERGVIYTIADGDQPAVQIRELELVRSLGLEAVAAVNCKRNLDVHQNPDDSRPYAERDGTSVHMTTAFGDGTKMQIEQAVVANLTGLVPAVRGMHGVDTTLATAARDVAAAVGGTGAVEFTLGGDFGGGVFVVGRSEDDRVRPYLRYGKLGDGPDYLFFRPFHLFHLELPLTLADVIVDGRAVAVPAAPPVAEVVAVAKRSLQAGDRLDGIGGFACYGHVDTIERAQGLLPIGLAEGAVIVSDIEADEPIPLRAVELDETREIVRRRRRQDALVTAR